MNIRDDIVLRHPVINSSQEINMFRLGTINLTYLLKQMFTCMLDEPLVSYVGD